MALCTSTAATDESTPPESPQITCPAPTFSRIEATVVSIKCAGVQSPRAPQMVRKFRMSCGPSGVWCTSGWNCTAQMRRSSLAMPASAFAVTAMRRKPAGSSSASSPWLIQTWIVGGQPGEQRRRQIFERNFGMAVLALGRRAHLAAQVMHDEMQPVADAQHGHAELQAPPGRQPEHRRRTPTTARPKESTRSA